MAKKAIVFLADGFEEVEAVTPVDYLRRAGIEVTAFSVASGAAVRGAHGIVITADSHIGEPGRKGLSADGWDAVVIPGGMPGAANLAACAEAGTFFREMAAAGRIVGALCASPAVVLAPLGLLEGKRFTCYPGMEEMVRGGKLSPGKTVTDGNLITSRGPGTAADFALALVEKLAGPEERKKLAGAALL